jgi:predicted phosphodiesterase
MIIVAISDTHGRHSELKLPKGDVLVHAGDFCTRGSYPEFEDFIIWFDKQPFEHKIFIAGNHDGCLEAMIGSEDSLLSAMKKTGRIKGENLHYLRDSSVVIDLGIKGTKKFYGAPWQPFFCDWAFQRQRGKEMAEKWALIPDDTDVLITHGPPYGHGDLAPAYFSKHKRNAGCLELLKRIIEVKPLVHICGHIHCGYGRSESDEVKTLFVNAATCNEKYEASNPAQEIDLGAL